MQRFNTLSEELESIFKQDSSRKALVSEKRAIEVCGFDYRGRFFTERASTFDSGDPAYRFRLRVKPSERSVVAIRSLSRVNGREMDTQPELFQIVREDRQPDGWIVVATKLHTEEKRSRLDLPGNNGTVLLS
jgi:hypothetical protein